MTELIDGEAKIPNILLTMAGTINVYVYPADRTVFATALWVMAREKPDDYVYTETEVLSYITLDEKIGDLAKLTTTARENLVAAINEAATKGMASIYMRVAEGYIEYSGDGVNWKQLIAVAELKGDKGDKGDPGSDATVDIVTPTAESTATQAASAKAVWDMLGGGGGSGTDISLGVTGASVGDIIKIKAVDTNGKPTAWEAAGLPRMRLIKSITIEEAVVEIASFNTDDNGNRFSLKALTVIFNGKNGVDETKALSCRVWISNTDTANGTTNRDFSIVNPYIEPKTTVGTNATIAIVDLRRMAFEIIAMQGNNNTQYRQYPLANLNATIKSIMFSTNNRNETSFGVGTKIEVWGIDA